MNEQFRLIHLHTVDKEKISGEQPFKVNHVLVVTFTLVISPGSEGSGLNRL
jgi:hypothetical protein